MRNNEKNPNKNHDDYLDVSEVIANLLNLRPQDVNHVIWLYYEVLMHRLCNKVLDSDHKVSQADFEIPFMGDLILDISNSKITNVAFKPENDFISELNKAIEKGESELINLARESVGRKITQRYKELI